MNLLIESLPTKIRINDKIHEINTDYRTCLNIITAWEDDSLTQQEKIYITILQLYKETPKDLEVAIQKALLFLNCGDKMVSEEKIGVVSDKPNLRLYSFSKDHKYIYSAMDQVSGGKLSSGELFHWYIFCNMFLEISKDSFFSRMIYLRSQKAKGKLNKEEKQFWRQNKDILELEEVEDTSKEVATEDEVKNMEEFERKFKEAQERKKRQRDLQN